MTSFGTRIVATVELSAAVPCRQLRVCPGLGIVKSHCPMLSRVKNRGHRRGALHLPQAPAEQVCIPAQNSLLFPQSLVTPLSTTPLQSLSMLSHVSPVGLPATQLVGRPFTQFDVDRAHAPTPQLSVVAVSSIRLSQLLSTPSQTSRFSGNRERATEVASSQSDVVMPVGARVVKPLGHIPAMLPGGHKLSARAPMGANPSPSVSR